MLTPEERKQYEYDIQEQEHMGFQSGASLSKEFPYRELLDALEKTAMEDIQEANFEIGVFLHSKDVFPTQNVLDMATFFIIMAKYKIERNYNDIHRWREYRKEYC
jgi:hypothetical protein